MTATAEAGQIYLEGFVGVCGHGHGGAAHLLLHDPRLVGTWGRSKRF